MRRAFLDALRGAALVLMVVNHTARWWMDDTMGWGRYRLIYATTVLAGPIFLFLVGFCLALSYWRRSAGGTSAWWPAARGYLPRGLGIVAAGWLLNLLVFPDEPFWSGGVLQTIGLGIVASVPALPLLRFRAGRAALVALGAALYLAFLAAHPALTGWVAAHPAPARLLFFDFPPWPWIGLVLAGLALGAIELGQPTAVARRRYYGTLAGAGVAGMVAVLEFAWAAEGRPLLFFQRDLMLNRHWTPGPATAVFVMGAVLVALAAAWWWMDVRGHRARWLVILGRSALMLYVLHQVIVLTLVREALGVRFEDWTAYLAATAVLVSGLVALGWAWIAVREPVKDRLRTPGRALAGRARARRSAVAGGRRAA